MDEHFIFNDQFYKKGEPVVTIDNRGLRYGDGLFETMLVTNGKIILEEYHFQRLFAGMKKLAFEIPSSFNQNFFHHAITNLLARNSLKGNARIRVMILRNEGRLLETTRNFPDYSIEAFPLKNEITLNQKGLVTEIFPSGRKSCDTFSNIKSNNYLISTMAQRFSQQSQMDDAIILNSFERICETSISNIFIVKNETLFTPALSEGCVAGTMRRWILEKFRFQNYSIEEKSINPEALFDADEIFLTNAISLIRWVGKFRNKTFNNAVSTEIFTNMKKQLL